MPARPQVGADPEINAIATVFSALKSLEGDSAARVLDYVRRKLNLDKSEDVRSSEIEPEARPDRISLSSTSSEATKEGVSPIADKWLRRSGLSLTQLDGVFNVGAADEIDLVAAKLPGTKKAARVREVMLLKAIASYLSTGVPKVTHGVAKQTCEHYDAYDVANFSKTIKSLAPEISGSKQSGYTLTARGLAASADLIKRMISPKA